MKERTQKIVIATGGSGGHIFPALWVGQELKKDDHGVVLAGSFGTFLDKVQAFGFEVRSFPSVGLRSKNPLYLLKTVWNVLKSTLQALRFLASYKPDVVAGFGGYGAFPVLLAARLLKIPILLHEQNVVPGRANRLLAGWSDRIAVSFSESLSDLPRGKTILTGCPCRSYEATFSRRELRESFQLQAGLPVILVLGGSQGSEAVNNLFLETAERLSRCEPFQVIHVTGQARADLVRKHYQGLGIPCYVAEFLDELDQAYLAADMAVSRAGAVSIFELATFGVPAVLVPYPYAGCHQDANAQVLADIGLAQVVQQSDLTPDRLIKRIDRILRSPQQKSDYRQLAAGRFRFKAACHLASEITYLGEK